MAQNSYTREEILTWPKLTRFYGIPPAQLARLPRAIREIYLDSIPELEAMETIEAIQVAVYPYMKEEDQAKLRRKLLGYANIEEEYEKIDTNTVAGAAAAAQLGIGVVTE